MSNPPVDLFDFLRFDEHGLIPVIAQRHEGGEVLMMAWMNREALEKTLATGFMHYWSRSRGKLWKKGETSGQTQALRALYADCDGDTLLARVEQTGVACHTGRPACFFYHVENGKLHVTGEPLVAPEKLYGD